MKLKEQIFKVNVDWFNDVMEEDLERKLMIFRLIVEEIEEQFVSCDERFGGNYRPDHWDCFWVVDRDNANDLEDYEREENAFCCGEVLPWVDVAKSIIERRNMMNLTEHEITRFMRCHIAGIVKALRKTIVDRPAVVVKIRNMIVISDR